MGFSLSASSNCLSSSGLSASPDMNCQPSKSIWRLRSSRHADCTAGLNVRISTRFRPICLASWYVANVLPKRILAFQRNFGVWFGSSRQDSKYFFVLATAAACSGRMAKFWSRFSSFSMLYRTASQAAFTSSTPQRNHSPSRFWIPLRRSFL